jgi:hypothetical protein
VAEGQHIGVGVALRDPRLEPAAAPGLVHDRSAAQTVSRRRGREGVTAAGRRRCCPATPPLGGRALSSNASSRPSPPSRRHASSHRRVGPRSISTRAGPAPASGRPYRRSAALRRPTGGRCVALLQQFAHFGNDSLQGLDSSKESSHVQLSPSLSELSPSLSPSCVRAVSPSCLRAVSPCDCMAADLVRALVADGAPADGSRHGLR